MTDRASPTESGVIAEALDALADRLWTCGPARVVAYDPATKTCTAQPLIRRPILTEDGAVEHETPAQVQNVPVAFFGGGDLTLTFEPETGDTVLLVYCDYSPAGWRSRGDVSDAGDLRAHGPAYPVAYPWYRPSGGPGEDGAASIGKPGGLRLSFGASAISAGGGADFVALAGLVLDEISALRDYVETHTHPYTDTPVGPSTTLSPASPPPPVGPVASANLKAD